ncbi:esterase [Vallitalea longa]|uniref:Esterase n=1 Tax=Vallitalea longa TaxID=2936439 RepID=A0A9W6DHG9_9FIRM|nr:alpha/beta hydrolase family protein [Vallitalea longa]GKX31562.1 esterase [Vallitalea longa]
MALIECNFTSKVLELSTDLLAVLPEKSIGSMKKYPVLYLLHGLSDDHTGWQRRTLIENYVRDKEIVIIMPNVHRSFYTDMKNGYKYFEFVSEELPSIVKEFFPISDKREDTFVAGLSMGGFGAMKLALNYPDRYSKAASLSGALGMVKNMKEMEEYSSTNKDNSVSDNITFRINEMKNIFGSYGEIKESCNDLFYLLDKNIAEGREIPNLYQSCGTEDSLYDDNIRFRDYVKSKGIHITYEECEGDHTWDFWNKMIEHVIEWLDV